jgi:integrative and conjugative element protein (TIGR02256 family)
MSPRRRPRSVSRPEVWLSSTLLTQITKQGAQHAPLETGGMLLGWRRDRAIVVRAQVEAGPAAHRALQSFTPDGDWQQRRLEEAYEQSDRTVTYLGDWHSHPRGSGRPSPKDRHTAAAIAAEPLARASMPVTLILGRRRPRRQAWRARAFLLRNGSLRRIRLVVYTPTDEPGELVSHDGATVESQQLARQPR